MSNILMSLSYFLQHSQHLFPEDDSETGLECKTANDDGENVTDRQCRIPLRKLCSDVRLHGTIPLLLNTDKFGPHTIQRNCRAVILE